MNRDEVECFCRQRGFATRMLLCQPAFIHSHISGMLVRMSCFRSNFTQNRAEFENSVMKTKLNLTTGVNWSKEGN